MLYLVRKEAKWEGCRVIAVATSRLSAITLANKVGVGYNQIPMSQDDPSQVYLLQDKEMDDLRIVVNEVEVDEVFELCSAF